MTDSNPKKFRIFLASLSDTTDLRETVVNAVAGIDADLAWSEKCFVELLRWDDPLRPGFVP